MYASNSHSYTHLILALGIVREPTVWVFITSKYPGIHVIGLPNMMCSAFGGWAGNQTGVHADRSRVRRFVLVVQCSAVQCSAV